MSHVDSDARADSKRRLRQLVQEIETALTDCQKASSTCSEIPQHAVRRLRLILERSDLAEGYLRDFGLSADADRLKRVTVRFANAVLEPHNMYELLGALDNLLNVSRDLTTLVPLERRSRGQGRRRTKSGRRTPAKVKILSGLCAHHKYEKGFCKELAPIVVNAAASEWDVGNGTLSEFLSKHFGGYDAYFGKCNRAEIAAELKRLGDEYMPRHMHSHLTLD